MYAAIIQGIMQAVGTSVAANQMQKARGGYEAQLSKYKDVEPIREPNPQLLDWSSALGKVLAANREAAPRAREQAHQQNTFNLKESQGMYRALQPFFDQLQTQIGQNALSYSRGELPADVVNSVGRAAASRGLQSGFGQGASGGGSGTSLGGLNLRNLGLTSLDLSRYGTNLAMQANQQAKALSPPLADMASMFLTPAQGIGYELGNLNTLNESNRYWNTLQNQAEWGNTATANQTNQLIAEGNLASRMAEAQMWSQMGSSSGGATSGGGGGGGGIMGMFGGGGGGGMV